MIEPAYVAIAILIGVPLHMLIGALLAGRQHRQILYIADEVLASPDATDDDRHWLKDNMHEVGNRGVVWFIALTAPLWTIPALVSAIIDVAKYRGVSDDEKLRQSRKQFQELNDRLEAQGVRRSKPAQHSELYLQRYPDLSNASFNAMLLKAPLLSLWIGAWFLPATLPFFLSSASNVATKRVRMMIEAAFRRVEAMVSPTA